MSLDASSGKKDVQQTIKFLIDPKVPKTPDRKFGLFNENISRVNDIYRSVWYV